MTATILFATKNPGKYAEFVTAFHKFSPQTSIISLADLDYQIPDCIDLALAVTGGDTQVGLASLARAVDDAAHHGHAHHILNRLH